MNIALRLESKRQLLLLSITVALMIAVFLMDPIAQNQNYHQFSDQKTIFSIPNFWNVISNIPFIIVGLIGLISLNKIKLAGSLPQLNFAYTMFFIGLLMTGVGSSYYHWNPHNASLVWDRLPMTLSFMAFFSVILGENISIKLSKRSFYPLLIIGIVSVAYWIFTETNGAGDLRPYILVQFLPVILIPLILWLYPSPFIGQGYIVAVLIFYVLAKLMEHFDHEIYSFLTVISGHSIKHITAAFGTYFFYLALRIRKPN